MIASTLDAKGCKDVTLQQALNFEGRGEELLIRLWNLAVNWAEYEEEEGTLILGYSIHYLILYHRVEDEMKGE